MTRSELITKLAAHFPQLTHSDAELAALAILDKLSSQLASGGRIELRGFGSFSIHNRPPRLGRNPKTGEKVAVPAKYAPHFKPGVDLRGRVNGSAEAQKDEQNAERVQSAKTRRSRESSNLNLSFMPLHFLLAPFISKITCELSHVCGKT